MRIPWSQPGLGASPVLPVIATWFAAGPTDPLAAPQRQTMLRLVQACPGLTVRALQAKLSYQWSSFYLHLRRLVDAGLIRVEDDPQDARIRRIYPCGEESSRVQAPPRVPVLKGLSLDVARIVVLQPGLDFSELSALLQTPSRNVHYHLKRLCELGLVTSASSTRYRDLQPSPALVRAVEAAGPAESTSSVQVPMSVPAPEPNPTQRQG